MRFYLRSKISSGIIRFIGACSYDFYLLVRQLHPGQGQMMTFFKIHISHLR